MERRDDMPGASRASRMVACLALTLGFGFSAPVRAELSNLAAIATGSYHTCALTAAGGVKCWGDSSHGQVGDGVVFDASWWIRWMPVDVQGLTSGVVAISAGSNHTCALTTAGTVKCWGDNFNYQLGNNDSSRGFSATPVDVPGLAGVVAISAGGTHTCALTSGGGLKCWGNNAYGQLGDGTTTRGLVPADVPSLTSGVAAVSVGSLHTCALTTSGGAKCWGYNEHGQIGDNSKVHRSVPVDVVGLGSGVASVVAGGSSSCAVTTGGAAKCWGDNYYYQVGDGGDRADTSTWTRTTPTAVSGLAGGVAQIVAGTRHGCVRMTGGGVKCWGENGFYGEIGDGTYGLGAARTTPVDVVGLAGATALVAGNGLNCALIAGGKARCWGSNREGQLGSGFDRGIVPRPSVGVPDFQLAVGTSHNLLVNGKGEVWAWGDNTTGKLGNGNTTGSTIPVRALGLDGIVGVSAGMSHSLAVKRDGTVWAWGLHADGQLGIAPGDVSSCVIPGDDTYPCALVPTQVPGLEGIVAVSAGWRHSLALRSDGTVWRWGNDNLGGIGPASSTAIPALVPGIGFAIRISAGYMHSVAVETSGNIYVWGRAERGELGPSTTTSTATPVNVYQAAGDDAVAGGGFTIVRQDTRARVWGLNVYGALGDVTEPTTDGSFSPGFRAQSDEVPGMTDVAAITAGFGFAGVRRLDGTVWTWGLDNRGQLGNGGAAPHLCGLTPSRPCARTPVHVAAHDGALRFVAGAAHALAIRPDGTIIALGDNLVGQHGNRGGNYKTDEFTQIIYDPDFTLTPGGAFGTPSGVGTTSTTGSLNAGTIGDGLAFGAQAIGVPTGPVEVVLSNLSASDPISVTGVGTSPSGEFAVDANGCTGTLAGGGSCTIALVFNPSAPGSRSASLTITSNAANSATLSFALSGTGIDPRAASTLALVASAPSTPAGATVTFTATVGAGAVTPTGTVAFRDGGVAITGCGAIAVAAGSAACATDALPVGVRSITAEYSGDGAVQPSASAALAHTVFTEFALTVAKSGAGAGTVASSPAGIDCGGDCTQAYAAGTSVTLTATAASGSVFSGWSGACTGTGGCVVTMDAARSVTVAFGVAPPNTFALTVAKAGTGSGTVTSLPAGIDCGASCTFSFNAGASVTLAATPASGSVFAGWSGGGCSGTGTCIVTTNAATGVTATFTATVATNPPRLGNISTRGQVLTGDNVMIGGFIIGGATAKTVLVRARGPSMIPAGVLNAMANPQLTLVDQSTAAIIGTNDNWGDALNASAITATGKAPTNAFESAILLNLNPGAYTAVVSGVGGTTGVGIIEVFEIDGPTIPLTNISTRGRVLTGDDVMIGGFIIDGDSAKTVLIRARGPSMIPAGVTDALPNPQVTLVNQATATIIGTNDDWGTATNAAAITATGLAPTNALESAILVTLQPGAYTVVVSGVGGATGVGIVEVFAQ